MPKPIKKRIVKKVNEAEEVKNRFNRLKTYYDENARNVRIAVAAVLVVILSIGAVFFYERNISDKAAALQHEAVKTYFAGISEKNNNLFQESLSKLKEAYGIKKSPLLLYYEADIHQRTGEIDKAIDTLNSLIENFSSDEYIAALGYSKLGMLYRKKGEQEKALQIFEKLENNNLPVYGDLALHQKAKIYKKMGKKEEAKKDLEKLVERFPDSPFSKEAEAELKVEKEKEEKETAEKKPDTKPDK